MPRSTSEDGYELWLRYPQVDNAERLAEYRTAIQQIEFDADSPTLIAARDELLRGLRGLLGVEIPPMDRSSKHERGILSVDCLSKPQEGDEEYYEVPEGQFFVFDSSYGLFITAHTDVDVLYGVFAFLRHLQMHKPLSDFSVNMVSAPKIQHRILDHWDNLDGTIERGYAGFSLWDWHKLPDYLSPRYTDYARACASVGINGAVLNNANAKALSLTHDYLVKAAALANVFRPYGIRVYLSARFSAPIELGGLSTADPLDPAVIAWWKAKADEIYALIPDFGGWMVKANSEDQPGPGDYGRTQADGANLLADALAAHGGIVNWRAFIYDSSRGDDRAKQAYDELTPLDGLFHENVLVQVKNGPIDFQPREPFHPLFGAMPKTNLSLEVQITQEYLGQATHLCYLAPLFKEVLDADTYAHDEDSLVAQVIDGTLDQHGISAMAGVANIGDERNWCGHPFAANWFAFGRAWDHTLTSDEIADDWLRMTFNNDDRFIEPTKALMLASREVVVNSMTPLGLHHIMAAHHHYGPAPWIGSGRRDWQSGYYHRADASGLGFDRTSSGSNAVAQYFAPYRDLVANLATCPEELLLWFHHVGWDYPTKSGRTLWDELCYRYNSGVGSVREMQQMWALLAEWVDPARFEHVRALLKIQEQEAIWWRDACLLYFQTFSHQPIPTEYEPPAHDLDTYEQRIDYFVPGIRENHW